MSVKLAMYIVNDEAKCKKRDKNIDKFIIYFLLSTQ